jgi:hypothetical protein
VAGQCPDQLGCLVERAQQRRRLQVEAAVQLLGLVADAVGVLVAQEGRQQLAGPLADRPVDAPRVDVAAEPVERPVPGVDVQVVGVDECAVDVEQGRGADGRLLEPGLRGYPAAELVKRPVRAVFEWLRTGYPAGWPGSRS